MIEWVLNPIVALNLWHSEFLWQGTGIDGCSERRVSSVTKSSRSLETRPLRAFIITSICSFIAYERGHAQVLPFGSAGLVTAFWPFGSPSFGIVTLVFLLDIVSRVPLM